jgi:hypothetical protein
LPNKVFAAEHKKPCPLKNNVESWIEEGHNAW